MAAAGSSGGGSIVLRGNQLVWVPNVEITDGGGPSGSGPSTSSFANSPIKIQLVGSAATSVKTVPFVGQNKSFASTFAVKVAPKSQINPVPTSGNAAAQQTPRSSTNFMVRRQPSPASCGGPSTVLLKGRSGNEFGNSLAESTPFTRTVVRRTYSGASAPSGSSKNFRPSQQQPRYKIIIPAGSSPSIRSAERSDGPLSFRTLQPIQASANYTVKGSSALAGSFLLKPKSQIIEPNNSQIVYLTGSGDIYSEDDAHHGLSVGANSLQSISEVSSLNAKKQVYLKGLRKPCNCTKSACLKLYCECFANGEFCKNCNCTNCKNVMSSENDRSRAIKSCLERNPAAFQPKIGKGRADTDRLHNKGCNCKKSSCLKNYCECYEAKVACTSKCKCVSCRNSETDRNQKARISGGTGLLSTSCSQPTSISRPSDEFSFNRPPSADDDEKLDPKKMPWFYMNDDVVQATALCLVAQAEQLENAGVTDEPEMQLAVLHEFGACLQQIIQSATC